MDVTNVLHKGWLNAHCATVCRHNNGVLVAFYEGPECQNSQRVVIEYWEKAKMISRLEMPYKTGNCVLIPAHQSQAFLIFSHFTDTDGKTEPHSPVQRWMYCTNWKTDIMVINGQVRIGEERLLEVEPYVGLLTRCTPIWADNRWLLPIYREHDCYGSVIESKDGWSWAERGKIGANQYPVSGRFGSGILIQPTIWHNGRGFESLSRDISPNHAAWYSKSPDARTWTEPVSARIDNFNNSVVAIQDTPDNPQRIVWNIGHSRSQLALGHWDTNGLAARPKVELGPGSYPNYCWDFEGNLHIVYTSNRKIMHHILDREALSDLDNVLSPTTPRKLGWKITE